MVSSMDIPASTTAMPNKPAPTAVNTAARTAVNEQPIHQGYKPAPSDLHDELRAVIHIDEYV